MRTRDTRGSGSSPTPGAPSRSSDPALSPIGAQELLLIADHVPALLAYVGADERYRFVNRNYEEYFGRPRGEIVGLKIGVLLGDEHNEAIRPFVRMALGGETAIFERRLPVKDRGHRWLKVTYVPHLGDDGAVEGFFVLATDLTDHKEREASLNDELSRSEILLERETDERREAEGLLLDREARLDAILRTAVDPIIIIDEHGRIDSFNLAAEQLFGFSAEEMVGQNVKVLMPSPFQEEHDAYLARYRSTGERRIIGLGREVSGRRKDGTEFPMELAISEVRLGERRLFTGIVRDLTERKLADQAIRRGKEFAESLIETAQAIILVLDQDGRIVRFNAYLERVSGWSLEEVRGRDWFTTFLPERDRERIQKVFRLALEERAVGSNINPIVTRDGKEREIEWNARLLRDASGQSLGLLCVGSDVTERLEAEKRMRGLERDAQERARLADIGAIASKIVHDLGNPLAGLMMQAQLVTRAASTGGSLERISEAAEDLLATARHMDSMIREFRQFSRGQRLELCSVELAEFLDEVVRHWQPRAARRKIDLDLALPADLPRLDVDEGKLRRVLDNLVKNALEAVDQGPGQVTIRVAPPANGKIVLSVEDSGPGIPESLDVFRLFETTKEDGTGLGLPVSLEIVRAHGGGMRFASIAPHGTVFHVELPLEGRAV